MFKILIGSIFLLICTQAYSFPDKPENYLLDSAKILTAAEKNNLSQLLASSGETENYVLIYKSSGGKNPDGYAKEIGEKWLVRNGTVLIIFTEDKQAGIYIGADLLSIIDTSIIADIKQTKIDRYLKQNQYNKAAMKGANALIKATEGIYSESRPEILEKNQTDILNIFSTIAIVFFIITFLSYVRKQKRNLALNEYEDAESEGNIPHRKLIYVYIIYGLYFLLVLNGYRGELFGTWKKIIPLIATFPLFGFFVLNMITVTMGNPFIGKTE